MRHQRPGFTLLELLLLIILVVVILGLILIPTQRVRINSARNLGMNNLRQLGIGCHAYQDVNKRLPFNGNLNSWGDPHDHSSGSWLYQILPYIEQEAMFKAPDKWRSRSVPMAMCGGRGRTGHAEVGEFHGPTSDYAMNCWLNDSKNGALDAPLSKLRLGDIPDGAALTILLGQSALRTEDYNAKSAGDWRETLLVGGRGGTGRAAFEHVRDGPGSVFANRFGGPFDGGTLFCMADCSSRQIGCDKSLREGLRPEDGFPAPKE